MRLPRSHVVGRDAVPAQTRVIAPGAYAVSRGGVQPSDIACDLCMAGCNLLSGWAKTACQLVCKATVC